MNKPSRLKAMRAKLDQQTRWEILILVIAMLILSTVVLFALHSFRIVEEEMAQQFNREQSLLAEQMAMGIQQYLNDITNVMALTSHIAPVTRGDPESIKRSLENAYQPLKNKISMLFWEDAQGVMQDHLPRELMPGINGKNFGFRTYFKVAKEIKVPYVSDIITVGGEENQDIPGRFLSIIIVYPLLDENERFNGVIGCAIDLESITAHYVAPIKPSSTGYAWLMDESGMLLYHPDRGMLGRNMYKVLSDLRMKGVNVLGLDEVRQAMELKNNGMYEISFPHFPTEELERKLLAFSSVHFLNRRWTTVITSPYREVVYLMSGTFRNTLSLGSFGIAFVVITTIIMLRINKARIKAWERNKWADEVLTAHKRLETIFDGVPHYLAMIDAGGIIQDVNQMYADFYGTSAVELIGRHCIHDFSPQEIFCPWQNIWECIQNRSLQTVHDHHIEIKGVPYYFDISVIPLLGAHDNVEHIIQYGVDITDKKALTAKLVQAEKLATVGQISAHMAHEIRNPLTSISLHAELLMDEFSPPNAVHPQAVRLLTMIMDEIDRLSTITDEYLAYARLPVPKKQLIQPDVEVAAVQTIMLPEMKRRGINFKFNADKSIHPILIDRGQFRQVLINLIKNAMDAMPSGGSLEVTLIERGENCVAFIKDSGNGIPKEITSRIFDPYFTTKVNGTGLGLYLVQYIANAHDGWVEVESQPGSGSTFIFSIPIYNETTKETEKGN